MAVAVPADELAGSETDRHALARNGEIAQLPGMGVLDKIALFQAGRTDGLHQNGTAVKGDAVWEHLGLYNLERGQVQ